MGKIQEPTHQETFTRHRVDDGINTRQDTAAKQPSNSVERQGDNQENIIDQSKQGLDQARDTVVKTAKNVTQTVLGTGDQATKAVADTVGSTVKTIVDTTGEAKNTVVDAAGNVTGTVVEKAGEAKDVGVDTAGDSASTIIDSINEAKRTILETGEFVADPIVGEAQELQQSVDDPQSINEYKYQEIQDPLDGVTATIC